MKKHLITLLTSGILLGAVGVTAQVTLAKWDLQGSLSATTVDASLSSASDLSFVNLINLGYDGIGIEFDGMPSYPATTDYVTVTMTAASGNLDLNGGYVKFDADYINGSRTGDGYTVELISDPSGTATTLSIGTSDDAELAFDSGTISGFTPANIVELRVYWNNGQSWGDQQMANLTVAVPEPSTYALFTGFLVLGGVMLRRRLRE
jgi:hypothetical protein